MDEMDFVDEVDFTPKKMGILDLSSTKSTTFIV